MRRLFRQLFLSSLSAAAAFVMMPAQADEDSERENLARLEHEIALLGEEVRAAKAHAPTLARVRFQYDDLARDLDLIRLGITEHLNAPRQPRPIEPLKGDYRR
ncbi:RAQPRD family integrative conjugative element protein [Aromatoleum toluvorans]|nr:RAQPRD family integrative conjugative element protein [Aromatoleum toluvorans]